MNGARVLVALLVVLAGCGGVTSPEPTANETATPTATAEPATELNETGTPDPTAPGNVEMPVKNGELPFAPKPVFTDVLNLTGTAVDAPVVNIERQDGTGPDILDTRQSPFRRSLGITTPENGSVRATAYTPANGYSVYIYEQLLEDPLVAETTLAHEFVHIVQFKSGWGDVMWENRSRVAYDPSYDGTTTYYLVLEGAAVFVEDRYRDQYTNASESPIAAYGDMYANASALSRLSIARYYYGAQYVAERAGSPANLSDVHLHAPNSSEQVLHHSTDPIAPLEVSVEEADGWNLENRDRMGELFLRVALRTELNRSTAVDAAAGWGDDRKLTYTNGEDTASAWVLRWDDRTEATEFATAFTTYLEGKATQKDGAWRANAVNSSYRVERPTEETVVVFLGNDSFVRNATATQKGGEIVVEP
jgi:hypothetical protein